MNAVIEGSLHPLLSVEQIAQARKLARTTKRSIVQLLDEQLELTPAEFTAALAQTLLMSVLTNRRLHALKPAFDVLPFSEANAHECTLLRDEQGSLLMAIGDPFALDLQAWAAERIAEPFTLSLAHRDDIAAYLSKVEENMHAMDGVVAPVTTGVDAARAVEDLSLKAISENTSPIVRLVNSTLYDALKTGASDIHLESTGSGLAIRSRIDGVLNPAGTVQGTDLAEQVISRVKVMAELDIAERRIPQDGRFKVTVKGRDVDLRVSIMPSIFGEDAVLRILDKKTLADEFRGLRVDALGFDGATVTWLRKLANEP